MNKHTDFGSGLIRLFIQGGNYWFLYALFVLFLVYPLIERICNKQWKDAVFAVGCVLLFEFIKLPVLFELNRVVYYLPFFVLGRYLVKLLGSDLVDSHWLNMALLFVSLFFFIGMNKLNDFFSEVSVFKYFRAIAMFCVVYVPLHYLIIGVDNGSKFARLVERFLDNCSKYSLQLYLFNGFILVIIRTLLVLILGIHNPLVIVSSLLVSNLFISLMVCNYILPKTKWLAWLCGTGKRPWGKKE